MRSIAIAFSLFDIEKFDSIGNFNLWQIKMRAVLIQKGLKKVLIGKEKMPSNLIEEQKEEMDDKALTVIHLCLFDGVL